MEQMFGNSPLKEVYEISSDTSLSAEERIESVLALKNTFDSNCNGNDDKIIDEIIIRELIQMAISENEDESLDEALLRLYAMLAENLNSRNKYPDLKYVAEGTVGLLINGNISKEAYKKYLHPIIDILSETVYYHLLYEILARYFYIIVTAGQCKRKMKPYAELLIRLHILLDHDWYTEKFLDNNVEKKLSKMFSSEELMRIIRSPWIGRLKPDPIEYSPEWQEIYYKVQEEIDELFKDRRRIRGICHYIWREKKRILKEKYGIDWRSPAEMNPRVRFD